MWPRSSYNTPELHPNDNDDDVILLDKMTLGVGGWVCWGHTHYINHQVTAIIFYLSWITWITPISLSYYYYYQLGINKIHSLVADICLL